MKKSGLKIALGTGILVLGVFLLSYWAMQRSLHPAWSPGGLWPGATESEHIDGREYKITDVDNKLLSKMSREVTVGDELIIATGQRYRVQSVTGFNARAEFMGLDRQILAFQAEYGQQTLPVATQQNNWSQRPVALYHTHSAESYVPTDGEDSIPYDGGIYQVGETLAEALQRKGIKVLHDKTPHEPRDKNAYYRSRRTAGELIRKNPVAIFDVHRDGIPDPNYYKKTINGQDATQIRLVVGRQNPKMQSNMEFSKRILAYGNKVHPGLVKEIFIARGNYNQDLMSTAMLLEMGTHTNEKEAAQTSATLFADVLPGLLGVGGTAGAPGGFGPGAGSPAGWKTMAWILGLAVLGGGLFLLISSGNWANAKKRLGSFMGGEFGFMGPLRKRMDEPGSGQEQGGQGSRDGDGNNNQP